MVKGRATDTALLPGPHFVPALRRKMVEIYPAVELTYRAGGPAAADGDALERSGPPLEVTLGDRTRATVPYTFDQAGAGQVRHVRAVWSRRSLRCRPGRQQRRGQRALRIRVGIGRQFGAPLEVCQKSVGAAVADALDAHGIELTAFLLGAAEFGRTGDVIQATLRARHELERENAEASTRLARAANDADLQQNLTLSNQDAWRYVRLICAVSWGSVRRPRKLRAPPSQGGGSRAASELGGHRRHRRHRRAP